MQKNNIYVFHIEYFNEWASMNKSQITCFEDVNHITKCIKIIISKIINSQWNCC